MRSCGGCGVVVWTTAGRGGSAAVNAIRQPVPPRLACALEVVVQYAQPTAWRAGRDNRHDSVRACKHVIDSLRGTRTMSSSRR